MVSLSCLCLSFITNVFLDFRCFLHVFIKRNGLAIIHDHWLLDSPGTTED